MMINFGLRLRKDLVTCIRPAHTDQQVILRRDVANNIPLSLAAILPANNNVDQLQSCPRIKTQQGRSANKNCIGVTSICTNNNVGDRCQFFNIPLSAASFDLVVS